MLTMDDYLKAIREFEDAVRDYVRFPEDSGETGTAVHNARMDLVSAYSEARHWAHAIDQQPQEPTCPKHYSGENGECIDAIRTCGWDDGFIKGNILKYLFRHRSKGGVEDLIKARNYIDMLIKEEEK